MCLTPRAPNPWSIVGAVFMPPRYLRSVPPQKMRLLPPCGLWAWPLAPPLADWRLSLLRDVTLGPAPRFQRRSLAADTTWGFRGRKRGARGKSARTVMFVDRASGAASCVWTRRFSFGGLSLSVSLFAAWGGLARPHKTVFGLKRGRPGGCSWYGDAAVLIWRWTLATMYPNRHPVS